MRFATPSHRPHGVILMAFAMLTIPLVDGLAKHLSNRYPPLFLSWARYAVASLIVLPFAARIHGSQYFQGNDDPTPPSYTANRRCYSLVASSASSEKRIKVFLLPKQHRKMGREDGNPTRFLFSRYWQCLPKDLRVVNHLHWVVRDACKNSAVLRC